MHIFYDPEYLLHEQSGGHPECPDRLRGIEGFLRTNGLWELVRSPAVATVEDLSHVHGMNHIETIRNFGEGWYDMDTCVHPITYDIALKAVGGAIEAAKAALTGERSFAMVRPPGHHATRNRAMGFCYFNNVAVASAVLGKRSVILDIDVHHGNGTNDIFYSNPDVLYISTHQQGIFPGSGSANETGEGEGAGTTVNIPLSGGSGDSTFSTAFDEIIDPIIREFRPELFLVSIGGDSHYRDPLAYLTLSTKGYLSVAEHIFDLADELTNGGVAFALEGGYDIPALSETIGGIVAMSRGLEVATQFNDARDQHVHGMHDIEKVKKYQKEFWNLSG